MQPAPQTAAEFGERIQDSFAQIGAFVPSLLGALVILFAGYLLAKLAQRGTARLRTSLVPGFARPLAEPGRLRVSPGGLALARLTAARGGRGTFPVLALTF